MTSMSQHYPTMTTSWHQQAEAQTQIAQSPSANYHLHHMNSTHPHHQDQHQLQMNSQHHQQNHLASLAEHHEHATSSSSSYSLLDSNLAADSLSPTAADPNGANLQSTNLYEVTTSTSSAIVHVTSSQQQSNSITSALAGEKPPSRTNSQPSTMCHHHRQPDYDYPAATVVRQQQTSPSVIVGPPASSYAHQPIQNFSQQHSGWPSAAQSTSPQITSTSPSINASHRFYVGGSPHLMPNSVGTNCQQSAPAGHISPYSPNGYLDHHHHHNLGVQHHQAQQRSQEVSRAYPTQYIPHYQPYAHHHHNHNLNQHGVGGVPQVMQSETMQLNSPRGNLQQHLHSAHPPLPNHQQTASQIQTHGQHHHHQQTPPQMQIQTHGQHHQHTPPQMQIQAHGQHHQSTPTPMQIQTHGQQHQQQTSPQIQIQTHSHQHHHLNHQQQPQQTQLSSHHQHQSQPPPPTNRHQQAATYGPIRHTETHHQHIRNDSVIAHPNARGQLPPCAGHLDTIKNYHHKPNSLSLKYNNNSTTSEQLTTNQVHLTPTPPSPPPPPPPPPPQPPSLGDQLIAAAATNSPTNLNNNNTTSDNKDSNKANNNNETTDASNSNNSSTGNNSTTTTSRSKRLRTSFKHNQLKEMKRWFSKNQNPDAKDLKTLAQTTGLSKRVLQVWFQNARAKFRRNNAKAANQQMYVGECGPHFTHSSSFFASV